MDQCIYQKVSGSKICFLVLYVNGCAALAKSPIACHCAATSSGLERGSTATDDHRNWTRAQSDMNKLFKAFSQIDSGLARKFEGTGLGLAMVKQLSELHGGCVAVASVKDLGARFVVRSKASCRERV